MSTAVVDPNAVAADKPFDVRAHINAANSAEEATRSGKPPVKIDDPEPAKPGVVAVKSPEEAEDEEAQQVAKLPRSVRRELNQLRHKLGVEEGRRLALESLLGKDAASKVLAGEPKAEEKPAEDPEPQRSAFADDASYNRAMGKWDARQEAAKLETKLRGEQAQSEELESLKSQIEATKQRADAEIKELFPDFEEVRAAATVENGQPAFSWDDHAQLAYLQATSEVAARIAYFWMKHPEDLKKILAMTKSDPQGQIGAFRRLEGRVEMMYTAKQAEKPADKKPPAETAADRDAKLARPSEAVAVRSGEAANGTVPMFLADGKSINPAWKAMRNAEAGVRP